jgi:flagellar hook-associated protein 1 FlgK
VFIAGGQRLVLGNEASQLTVIQDDLDSSRAALAVTTDGQSLALSEGMLTGGSMAGLLRFQNNDLVDARNRIGQMATAFATQINEAQAKGLNLGDPPSAGSPLFTLGAPTVMPAAHNARDANGQVIGSMGLTVTDSSLLQASEYTLENDPSGSGQFLLVRLSDGLSRSVNDGDTVDGFRLNAGSPGPQAGDRFLLQPVAHAATGMTRALDDPNGIAAASPVTATMGTGNTGTASIASLTVTSPNVDTTVTANISFTNGTGDYTWELRDPLTGTVTSSGTGTWTAGQPISLNGFEVRLNGVPASGDSLSVAKTQFPATSNGNALQMAALRDATAVGRTVQADGSIAPGSTYTDAYANAMADVGVRVQSAKMSAQISAAVSTQADATMGAKTGVNLDEEAARLIQFQQSYQAAAKVLEVAQKVFDTMLQISGA